MTPNAQEEKRLWREKIRPLTLASPEDARRASASACDLLRQQKVWREAKVVLFYLALPGEIQLRPLLDEALAGGKTVALPRFDSASGEYSPALIGSVAHDCEKGRYGVLEPKAGCSTLPTNRLDLALAPGVAFDATGHRLGRGQGFYDRLLARLSAVRCGVAFEEQMVERLPAEPHDMRMNFILTPSRWRALSPPKHS